MKINNQQGFVLPMAMMMIVFFAILLAGLLPLVSAQFRFTRFDQDRINAQFTAEAGAKDAIRNVKLQIEAIVNAGSSVTDNNLNLFKKTYTENLVKDKLICQITCEPRTIATNLYNVYITSTGFCNGKRFSIDAIYTINSTPEQVTVEDLFNGCDYSNGKEWPIQNAVYENGILKSPTCAYPPDSGSCQVLFKKFPLQWKENATTNRQEINLSYNAACKKFPTNGSATGYGIYYGATGTANNMTGYVFQYDPGAIEHDGDGGSFFVKKVKAKDDDFSGFIGDLEWSDTKLSYTIEKKPVYKQTPIYKDVIVGYKNEWDWKTRQWVKVPIIQKQFDHWETEIDHYEEVKVPTVGGYYNTQYSGRDETTTPCWKPFQSNTGTGAPGADGTVKISLKKLKEFMEKKKPGTTFDINATHNVEIKIYKDVNGKERQQIFCDGILILNFVDNTSTCPIDFNKPTYAGLRVWNAKVDFFINPERNTAQGKTFSSGLIWKKHDVLQSKQ
jgi:hypothetical protein